MAQQVKAFAVKPDGLSLTPGTHMIETKNQLLQIIMDSVKSHACLGREF